MKNCANTKNTWGIYCNAVKGVNARKTQVGYARSMNESLFVNGT